MEYHDIIETAQWIGQKCSIQPTIALILGSGWGSFLSTIDIVKEIPYETIPHFPTSTVSGHSGKLVFGRQGNKELIIMVGRYHFYEGYPLDLIVFPIRVLSLLGVKTLIITNACGGIRSDLQPGDFMLITDHINMVGLNPLIGKNLDRLGPRFPDATAIYTPSLIAKAKACATIDSNHPLVFKEGVYAWWSGPSYETPAEIRMLQVLGADAVGMSTVPEALVASHMGMDILGIALITNKASGLAAGRLSHEEVLSVGEQSIGKMVEFLPRLIALL